LISDKIMEYTKKVEKIEQKCHEVAEEVVKEALELLDCWDVAQLKKKCATILLAINLIGE